ncbi:MAG: helix-turn-helix domain-containing protein [Candidatus Omnitrophica bacterium]|nr:helix-turn-helix domain-containing protein [Candidatus Omnitrophota bacterium]
MKETSANASSFSDAEARGWYTIPEAAEYLGISQPTLFRWMKDGLLSFYKVGRSTRFSREGLDAVVEKTTGQKEAEAASGRCLACGHGILVEGRLQGNSRLYFRPDKTRFWTLHEAMVPVRAKVCTACGHVQMQVEPEKVNRLRPKEEELSDQSDEN